MADVFSPGTVSVIALVAIIILFVMGLALVRRILFRISLRNAWRHRRSTALAIIGLMIGTAMISSAFSIGDSFKTLNRAAVFDSMAGVDERIVATSPSGDAIVFNDSVATALEGLEGGLIEGIAPALVLPVSVVDDTNQQGEARVNAIGLDPSQEAPFGPLAPDGFDVGDLPANGAALNHELATELGASEGDALRVFFRNPDPQGPPLLIAPVLVAKILPEKPERSKAQYLDVESSGENLFLRLSDAQELFGLHGKINQVRVTNAGGVEEGIEHTAAVYASLARAVKGTEIPEAGIQTTQSQIQFADEASDALGQLFFVFSTFTVIAGVMLIFLIFVLLALERKPEMGMARAVGMTRGQLIQAFILEGTLYSIAASAVGAFAGITISAGMLWAFGGIFVPEDPGVLVRYLTATPNSLALAFGLGFLITFITILSASVRVSRLNIIRAIRGIPEPTFARASRRQLYLGSALAALGLIVYLGSWGSQLSGILLGPSMVFLGIAPILRLRLPARWAYTIAGLAIDIWVLYPDEVPGAHGATANIEIFVVSGVLAVVGGVIVVIFNTTPLLDLLTGILARMKRSSAVLKIATTYPVSSAFRTGLVMAMVGLVVFTVTVVSVFGAVQFSNVDGLWEDQAGSYEVAGYSAVPFANHSLGQPLPGALANYSYDDIQIVSRGALEIYHDTDPNLTLGDPGPIPYGVIGMSDSLFAQGRFSFLERAPEYATDADVWAAARANASLVIADATVLPNNFGPPTFGPRLAVGQQLVLAPMGAGANASSAQHVKLIGVLNQFFFLSGIFMQQNLSESVFFAEPSIVMLDTHSSADANGAKLALESTYLSSGMQAIDTRAIIEEVSKQQVQVFVLIEVFMGLGLVVGIAGLGIVMLRNVRERRQQVGVLRAIGFQTRMVLNAFFIEASFISVLGLAVGLVLGLILAYEVWDDFFRPTGSLWVVPWDQLAVILLMAYLATTLAALGPARQASRMPPAEALRYVD